MRFLYVVTWADPALLAQEAKGVRSKGKEHVPLMHFAKVEWGQTWEQRQRHGGIATHASFRAARTL